MHFYLKFTNSSLIGILDVLLTDAMLVTTENPGPLQYQSQIHAKCGTMTPGSNRVLSYQTLGKFVHSSLVQFIRE